MAAFKHMQMFSTAAGWLSLNILITISAWGLWGIFDKLALQRSQPKDVLLVSSLLAIAQIPLLLALLSWIQPHWHLSQSLLGYAVISSAVSSLGMMLYLDAMKRADTTVVLGLTAGYPLVTQGVSLVFMGEVISVWRVVGALLIACGIVVIGLTDNSSPQPMANLPSAEAPKRESPGPKNRSLGRVFLAALLVDLCWGLKGVFEKLSLNFGTPIEAYYAECLASLLLLGPVLVWFVWRGYRPQLNNRFLWRYTALSEVMLGVGGLSYLTALSLAPAGYVVTVTSTYPLVMYFIAIVVLKEKFNLARLAGIACIVGGVLLV